MPRIIILECDHCHKQAPINKAPKWIRIGTIEQMNPNKQWRKLYADEILACSHQCLADWLADISRIPTKHTTS